MDYQNTLTTCTYCGCGCNFFLEVLDGKLVGTIPCKTSPVNEGKLCIKGWNVHQFVQSEKRLTHPMIRKNGVLEEVSQRFSCILNSRLWSLMENSLKAERSFYGWLIVWG